MKRVRSHLPIYSLALVLGFLAFTTTWALLTDSPEKVDAPTHEVITKLAFNPKPLDAHSTFTRQATDGELETSDETVRQSGRILTVSGILLQSQTLSVQTVLREHQLPSILIPSGRRSILFSRLII